MKKEIEEGLANLTTLVRRKQATKKTLKRIAELKIKQYNLDCSVDEYIKKCKLNSINN